MKKIVLILLMIVSFFSCSKDDNQNRDGLTNTIWEVESKGLATLSFFKDNMFTLVHDANDDDEEVNVKGIYVLSGKHLTLTPNGIDDGAINGTFDGSKIKISHSGIEVVFTKK